MKTQRQHIASALDMAREIEALKASNAALLEACRDTLFRLNWWAQNPFERSMDNAFTVLHDAISKATPRFVDEDGFVAGDKFDPQ